MTDVIGVDLGGTKIAAAVLRGDDLSESTLEPTNLSGQEELIDQLVRIIDELGGDRLDAVGVGVPSIVEFETGRVVSSANVPLTDVPLREDLTRAQGRSSAAVRPLRPQIAALNTVSTNSTNVTAWTTLQYSQACPIWNSSA